MSHIYEARLTKLEKDLHTTRSQLGAAMEILKERDKKIVELRAAVNEAIWLHSQVDYEKARDRALARVAKLREAAFKVITLWKNIDTPKPWAIHDAAYDAIAADDRLAQAPI